MNRSLLPLLPLATAVAMVFTAGTAAGQSLVQAPTPDLERPPTATAAASITTRSTVSGSITQSANSASADSVPSQIIGVGNVAGLSEATGTVQTEGRLLGSLVQTREGGGAGGVQEISIARVTGLGRAQSINATALVETTITQTASGGLATGSGASVQRVDVGGVKDVSGGSLVDSAGLLLGAGVFQSQTGRADQRIQVGSIDRVELRDVRTVGRAVGLISQTASNNEVGVASQRVAVGTARDSTGGTVNTDATISGDINQAQSVGSTQDVEVGSVFSAIVGSQAVAIGRLRGDLVQQANGRAAQRLDVGAVFGAVDDVSINASVNGDVSQVVDGGTGRARQNIGVGNVFSARGTVNSNAVVNATVSQSQSGGTGVRLQSLRVGSVVSTQADQVFASASVQGSVTQSMVEGAEGASQRTEIGSVIGVRGGVIRTQVSVDGSILQEGSGSNAQSILLGSVTAE